MVIVISRQQPTWELELVDPLHASNAEYEGVKAAIKRAHQLSQDTLFSTTVYADSVSAIKDLSEWAKSLKVTLKHIPGHLSGRQDVEVTEDVKRHNWAHVMARHAVEKALDTKSTSVHNDKRKQSQ